MRRLVHVADYQPNSAFAPEPINLTIATATRQQEGTEVEEARLLFVANIIRVHLHNDHAVAFLKARIG